MENVQTATKSLGDKFAKFADGVAESERNDFFDPRNRSTWQVEFGRWLIEQVGDASND